MENVNLPVAFAGMTKTQITIAADLIVQNVLETGNILEVVEQIAALEAFIKQIKSTDEFKSYALDEIAKHGKEFKSPSGAKIAPMESGISYGFEFCSMKPRNDLLQRTLIIAKSQLISNSVSNIIKYTTKNLRPDGSTYNSFPSGHTIQAFSMATILSMEYGKKYKWVPFASYALATSVGILRMLNNRHYISDVLAGAGIGIFSTKISYWTHRYRWDKK